MHLVLDGSYYNVNNIVVRKEFEGYLLYIPLYDTIYYINQSAKEIIDIMQEKSEREISIDQIAEMLRNKYMTSSNIKIEDIERFIAGLIDVGVISEGV